MRKARRWDRTPSKRSVLDTLLDKVLREMWPREDNAPPRRHVAPRARRKSRRDFMLEPLEPRLLMSADLSYTGTNHAFTLSASGSVLNLVDNANASNFVSVDVSALGTNPTVTIQRGDSNDSSGDTLDVNLDTSSALNSTIQSHGGSLTLAFTSTDQAADKINIDGTNPGGANPGEDIGYNLSVTSDSKIASSGAATVAGNLSITSEDDLSVTGSVDSAVIADANTGITLSNANLTTTGTGNSITLDAHSKLAVSAPSLTGGSATDVGNSTIQGILDSNLGSVNEDNLSVVISFDSAKIDINGGTMLNAAGDLNISSTVDGKLAASAVSNVVTAAVTVGSADPEIMIDGSGTSLTAGGAITAAATTNLSVSTTAKPNLLAKADPTADGGVAVTVFDSQALLDVSGSASVDATGATSLTANNTLGATTFGNASGVGAGAGVAVSVVYGDTTASVNGGTVDGSSVTLASTSTRTITTVASSSVGGSSASGGGTNPSEMTLKSNNASTADNTSTGDNSVSIAGAVAVNVDTGTTSSYITNRTIDATGAGGDTAGVVVMTTPVDVVFVTGSGASTGSTSDSVGVGVAIDVADRSNLAYVSGTTTITTGSLTILVGALDSTGAPSASSLGQSTFSVEAISGIGAPSSVGVAGSLAVNVVLTNNKAYIDNGAKLTLDGSPDVAIEADSNIIDNATAMPTGESGSDSSSVGVGISIAFSYGQDTTAAYIDDNAAIGGANGLTLTTNSTHLTATQATGGGKGKTAVTPVIAISVADNATYATIGSNVHALDGTSPLNIGSDGFTASSSLNDSVLTSATGDTKSSSTGVGISIALTIVNDSSLATTGSDLTTAGAAAFMSSAISGSESIGKASAAGGEDDSSSKTEDSNNQSVDEKTASQKSFADSTAKTDEAKEGGSAEGTDPKPGASKSPSASDSSGSVSVAGAVAVNIENGSSQAYIPAGLTITSTGTLTVTSQANVDGHALADGAATTSGGGVGVGVGVPITVNNITNLAYVANTATITSGGLVVSSGMADRTQSAAPLIEYVVTLDPSVNPIYAPDAVFGNDNIFVGMNSGLQTGDEVVYNPAMTGDAIGGLVNGGSYYVKIAQGTDNGSVIRLYGNGLGTGQADALAGDNNYVVLTSVAGTGEVQAFAKYITGPLGTKIPDVNPLNWVYFNPNGIMIPAAVTGDIPTFSYDPSGNVTAFPNYAAEPTFRTDSIFIGFAATFNAGFNTQLQTGDEVLYNPLPLDGDGGAPLVTLDATTHLPNGVLTPLGSYYVNVDDSGTIRLYNTKADAEAGKDTYIRLAPPSLTPDAQDVYGTEQDFFKYTAVPGVSTPVPNPIAFNPSGNVALLDPGGPAELPSIGTNSAFRTGDPVTYQTMGGTAFTGLDGTGKTTYYMIDVGGSGYYQVATSLDNAIQGNAVAISGAFNADWNAVVNDNADSNVAIARSGAGGGDIGVAGSVAINVVNNDTEAVVGKGGVASVTITGNGDVSVTAASTEENFTTAKPAEGTVDGSNVGIGGSVAVAVVTNTVNAEITDGTSISGTIGALTVSTTDVDGAYTHGENGATASSGVAVGISAAVAVFDDTVTTDVGTGSAIGGTGDVNITAALTTYIETATSAASAGSSVGIGASVSVAVVSDNVSAIVERDLATTGGSFTLSAISTVESDAQAITSVKGASSSGSSSDGSSGGADGQASKQAASANDAGGKTGTLPSASGEASSSESSSSKAGGSTSGGGDSSGVGIAAAVAVNVLTANNTAEITDGADITAEEAVTVEAEAQDTASAKGVGAAVAMDNSTNIGAAVALNVVNGTNEAYVDTGGSVVTGDGITVEAITPSGQTDNFVAWGAAAAGGGSTAAVAGSVGINVINNFTTKAYADTGSHLESSGAINVTAIADLNIQTLGAAGAFSKGGNGIGATITVGVLNATTTADIAGDADAAGAITIDAEY